MFNQFFSGMAKLGRFGFRIRAGLRWRQGNVLQIVAQDRGKNWQPDWPD
jgi:hypothetical protein